MWKLRINAVLRTQLHFSTNTRIPNQNQHRTYISIQVWVLRMTLSITIMILQLGITPHAKAASICSPQNTRWNQCGRGTNDDTDTCAVLFRIKSALVHRLLSSGGLQQSNGSEYSTATSNWHSRIVHFRCIVAVDRYDEWVNSTCATSLAWLISKRFTVFISFRKVSEFQSNEMMISFTWFLIFMETFWGNSYVYNSTASFLSEPEPWWFCEKFTC